MPSERLPIIGHSQHVWPILGVNIWWRYSKSDEVAMFSGVHSSWERTTSSPTMSSPLLCFVYNIYFYFVEAIFFILFDMIWSQYGTHSSRLELKVIIWINWRPTELISMLSSPSSRSFCSSSRRFMASSVSERDRFSFLSSRVNWKYRSSGGQQTAYQYQPLGETVDVSPTKNRLTPRWFGWLGSDRGWVPRQKETCWRWKSPLQVRTVETIQKETILNLPSHSGTQFFKNFVSNQIEIDARGQSIVRADDEILKRQSLIPTWN